MKVLFVFIDGVGLRPPATDNPVCAEVCPALCHLIEKHGKPIDACLGVPGLPQSATGQTTIYTGVNASRYMGRHCEGFPGPSLHKLIRENNIFMELGQRKLRCRFADAYPVDSVEDIQARRFKSVTTVMSLTQPHTISMQDDLLENLAVAHDITRQFLQGKGYNIPLVTPVQAATHLIEVARAHDFTLFEYFLTDLVGHSRDYALARQTLETLDTFLGSVYEYAHSAGLFLALVSDHGNIEDLSVRTHTRNPVPFVACGPGHAQLKEEVSDLTHITPAILRLMSDT